MGRSIMAGAATTLLLALLVAPSFSLPTGHVDDIAGKIMETDKRPKYMDTRDEIKELVYAAAVELVAEGKFSPSILPEKEAELEKTKSKRYMRICFTKMANHFVPYPCNGKK